MVMNKAYKVSVIALVAAVTYALVADRSTAGNPDKQFRIVYETTDASVIDQAHCLATNIYFEARHQEDDEKEAIANVVINRAKDKSFPDTICGVVYQAVRDSNGDPLRNKCQFSWYCDGKSDRIKDAAAYEEDFLIALVTMMNREEEGPDNDNAYDNTNNSLWYHAHYVEPYWAAAYTFQQRIGAHLFYSR
jgi:spore germination cell wall hydrolase CwlJ-like protein